MTGETLQHGSVVGRAAVTGRDAWAVDGFAPLPGDTVSCRPGSRRCRATVQTVYLCAESNGLEMWSAGAGSCWEDGCLLEIAPRGCALYDPPTMLSHGSGPFLELAAQDGALVRFEGRVRAGVWEARQPTDAWRPPLATDLHRYGHGPAPRVRLRTNAWGQLQATDAPQAVVWSPLFRPTLERDVYFTFADWRDGKSDPDALGLGVWMTDMCLAFGRRLGDSPAAARSQPSSRPDASPRLPV